MPDSVPGRRVRKHMGWAGWICTGAVLGAVTGASVVVADLACHPGAAKLETAFSPEGVRWLGWNALAWAAVGAFPGSALGLLAAWAVGRPRRTRGAG